MSVDRTESTGTVNTLPNDDNDASQRREESKPTPLPKVQLFIVLFMQVAEPVTSTVIYPFVNQLVRELHITDDEKKTGYYVGLIESIFYAAEALTVLNWGRASDSIGRKPILLGGMLGLALAMIGFGLSKNFWILILSRCAQGAFNGNVGVTKSVIAEITDPTNSAQAFSFLPVAWSIGSTLGPFIGGVFANPAERWSKQLGSSEFLHMYPYFLPCVIAALVPIMAFIFASAGLKETLSLIVETRRKKAADRTADESGLSATCTTKLISGSPSGSHNYGSATQSLMTYTHPKTASHTQTKQISVASPEKPPSIRSLFIPRVLNPIINFAFLAFIDQALIVLIPLMYSTSIEIGGLGFDPAMIGSILGIWGICNGFIQVLAFARIRRIIGHRNLYMVGIAGLLLCFSAFPLLSFLAKRSGRVDATVWAVLVSQLILYMFSYMAYGCMFMYIADAAPSRNSLGATNGLAQLTASTMRAFAPSTASSLFSFSLQSGLMSGTLVYWILSAVTLTALCLSFRLPKQLPSA